MYKFIKPSTSAVLILFMIAAYALFLSPLIGMADNGDFGRIMLPNGLKHEQQRDENDYFAYFNHKYDRLQYYNDTAGDAISTHSIIIKAAMFLDSIFTDKQTFDIRFLSIITLAVLSFAIYWIIEYLQKISPNRYITYLLAILAVFIFADIGYILYFNSFYGEAIAYPFYLLSIAALLKFSVDIKKSRKYLLIYFISSFIFMGSKNQFSLNGILSFLLLISVIFLRVPKKTKIFSLVLGILLLVSALSMYFVIDDNIYLINKYHMMTRGVMLFEPDIEVVTEKIGLDKQFSLLAETIYFDRTALIDPKDEILLKKFYPKYDVISVTLYYLRNPKAFSKLMEFGLKNSFSIRPEVIGNFQRSTGAKYGEKTSFFSLWSYMKENHLPHSANFIYFFLLICLVLLINRFIEYRRTKQVSKIFYFFEFILLYVFLTGFSQVLVSFIGAGDADLNKHLFMTTVTLDIIFYFNLVYLLLKIYKFIITKKI